MWRTGSFPGDSSITFIASWVEVCDKKAGLSSTVAQAFAFVFKPFKYIRFLIPAIRDAEMAVSLSTELDIALDPQGIYLQFPLELIQMLCRVLRFKCNVIRQGPLLWDLREVYLYNFGNTTSAGRLITNHRAADYTFDYRDTVQWRSVFDSPGNSSCVSGTCNSTFVAGLFNFVMADNVADLAFMVPVFSYWELSVLIGARDMISSYTDSFFQTILGRIATTNAWIGLGVLFCVQVIILSSIISTRREVRRFFPTVANLAEAAFELLGSAISQAASQFVVRGFNDDLTFTKFQAKSDPLMAKVLQKLVVVPAPWEQENRTTLPENHNGYPVAMINQKTADFEFGFGRTGMLGGNECPPAVYAIPLLRRMREARIYLPMKSTYRPLIEKANLILLEHGLMHQLHIRQFQTYSNISYKECWAKAYDPNGVVAEQKAVSLSNISNIFPFFFGALGVAFIAFTLERGHAWIVSRHNDRSLQGARDHQVAATWYAGDEHVVMEEYPVLS
ncbi:hypothetical protein BV898_15098 [Hypsibius exemplaris]|uniref:Uncharacterized protein n=1 Tax=Hypsibius exemplaris TaxID=2072580 RepID=A0A9X6RK64_HYPEX|nr:hypothetical protein BV898_15098 [Hypsibius exemplaris]